MSVYIAPMLPLLLAAAMAAPPPPQDAPVPCVSAERRNCTATVSPLQLFALADQLAARQKPDEAIAIFKALTQDNNADYRAEARVRIARLLILKGDLYSAADWYRRLLDEKPDAAAVRIELAQLLARIGDEGAATRQLRLAEAAGLPDVVSRSLRQARDFLKSQSPVGFNLSLGFAPDTNINAATTSDTVNIFGLPFELDEAGKAHSGLGLTYAADAVFRVKLKPGIRWITQIGSNGNLYRHSRFNDISASLDSGPELSLGRVSLRPSLQLGRRHYMSGRLYDYHGLNASFLLPVNRAAQISLGLSRTYFDYVSSYAQQTGPVDVIRLGYDRALTPRLIAHAGATRSRSDTRDPASALTSYGGELSLRRDFTGLSIYGQASVSRSHGDAPYFPFGVERNEHFYEGDMGLIFRNISWHGLSPQIKAMYVRNDSPIPIFQYRRVRGEISLTGSF